MKTFANYLWKTASVAFVAIGLSVAFSSSASADEAETDIAFEDQADPAYVEYLLELGSAFDADTLSPEEELLREEAERAARDAALVGFEERLAFVIDMYMSHPEFDGGVRSVANGVMYFSTTEAGYEYYSKELKSMIDDGYIVMDATFDMHWATDESAWAGGQNLGENCTGGLPATYGSSTGLITARHCLDGSDNSIPPTSYLGNTLGNVVSQSSVVDLAFVEVSGQTSGLVRTYGNRFEPMYFTQSPMVGVTACHFGVGSGYSCSTVRELINFPLTVGGKSLSKVAIMQGQVSVPGDSGGPWFSKTTQKNAMGIHKGEVFSQGAYRSVFTYIQAALDMGFRPILAADSLYQ
jgi:hypothetical protein